MTPEEDVPETSADDAAEPETSSPREADSAAGGGGADGNPDAPPGDEVDPRVDDVLGNIVAGAAAAAAADADQPDSADDLQARLTAAEARADENWDRLLRMQADMENKNKRAQRDVQNARKFALEGMTNDLLPIKDSLEMGLAAAQEEAASIDSIREGSELTLKMLASMLEKHHIVEINPEGEKFDPEFHQAMSMQPAGEGVEPNTVIGVMQKGYTLNDRLIRPALVMVSK